MSKGVGELSAGAERGVSKGPGELRILGPPTLNHDQRGCSVAEKVPQELRRFLKHEDQTLAELDRWRRQRLGPSRGSEEP